MIACFCNGRIVVIPFQVPSGRNPAPLEDILVGAAEHDGIIYGHIWREFTLSSGVGGAIGGTGREGTSSAPGFAHDNPEGAAAGAADPVPSPSPAGGSDAAAAVGIRETHLSDVAYYHPKINVQEVYEEGDVIGFFANPRDGNTGIMKLTSANAPLALSAGVISRSAYLHANRPRDPTHSDLVCMLGYVPVKVCAPVQTGDHVCACAAHPGVAVPSGVAAGAAAEGREILLGKALESAAGPGVVLVKCMIAMTLGAAGAYVQEYAKRQLSQFMIKLQKDMSRTKDLIDANRMDIATNREAIAVNEEGVREMKEGVKHNKERLDRLEGEMERQAKRPRLTHTSQPHAGAQMVLEAIKRMAAGASHAAALVHGREIFLRAGNTGGLVCVDEVGVVLAPGGPADATPPCCQGTQFVVHRTAPPAGGRVQLERHDARGKFLRMFPTTPARDHGDVNGCGEADDVYTVFLIKPMPDGSFCLKSYEMREVPRWFLGFRRSA